LNIKNQKRTTGVRGRRSAGVSGERERSRIAYGNSGRRYSFVSAGMLFCAVFAVLVAADYWMNAGKVYRGVEVGDVALEGQTPAEAKEIIGERERRKIELSGPDKLTFA
jgi:3-methyladenine DNA glycosylase Mpg